MTLLSPSGQGLRVGQAWLDFERVASGYDRGNLLLDIEGGVGREMLPSPSGKHVLDAGCGTGRWGCWALENGATALLQLDRADSMLQQARHKTVFGNWAWSLRADFNHLPVRATSFDCLIASLCIGYTDDLDGATAEMARCLRPGGHLYLSDMHPDTERLGWKRTYALPDGRHLEPAYHVHPTADCKRCLARHGFIVQQWRECFVDESIQVYFEKTGHQQNYRRWYGSPLLLLVLAEKESDVIL